MTPKVRNGSDRLTSGFYTGSIGIVSEYVGRYRDYLGMILGLYWAYNAPQTGRIKVAYSKTQRPAASRKASWGLGARSSGPGAFFNPEGVYGSFEDSFQGSFRDSFKGSFWGFLLGFLLWRVFF